MLRSGDKASQASTKPLRQEGPGKLIRTAIYIEKEGVNIVVFTQMKCAGETRSFLCRKNPEERAGGLCKHLSIGQL